MTHSTLVFKSLLSLPARHGSGNAENRNALVINKTLPPPLMSFPPFSHLISSNKLFQNEKDLHCAGNIGGDQYKVCRQRMDRKERTERQPPAGGATCRCLLERDAA